jgi:ureidoacrylate peracid hydrolase
MHPPYAIPASVRERVLRRQGKLIAHDTIDAARTALVVIDMQNYFCSERFAGSMPLSRAIVPNINRMARALRAASGPVMWIQTTAAGALERWANHHEYMLSPERKAQRLAGLAESSEGFELYAPIEALPTDVRVKKVKYSALLPDSSNLHAVLRQRGIESVLIAGTATNVCCETTARDAMVLDYRVVMLSDANAAWTDEEHFATLNNCALFFGDVMTTDKAIARLVPVAQRKIA